MIQSGLLDRIGKLELIITHLGGILPFLIDRLDSRNTGPAQHPPSHYLRTRVHVDNCGYPAGPALRLAIAPLGIGRLLIGRAEERRVGNECVSTCRYRGSPYP